MRVSKFSNKSYYQISLEIINTCHRTSRNRKANAKFLGKKNLLFS